MKLPFFLTIISGTLVLCSGTETMWDLCCLRQYLGGWPVAQFKPFAVCGKVSNLRVSRSTLYVSYVQPGRLGCTVGCVNRTTDAVRIELYNCNGEDELMHFPITLSDMTFFTCYTDEEIILRADNTIRFIEFTLTPDLNCLRHKRPESCMIIFRYYKTYYTSYDTELNHIAIGVSKFNINKASWKPYAYEVANNRARCLCSNLKISVLVLLFLYMYISYFPHVSKKPFEQ